jgi:hypothetical protein
MRFRTTTARRPGLYLGTAAAGAVLVNVLVGTGPGASADAGTAQSVSVARQLGLSASSAPASSAARQDLQPLADLAASRGTRQAEESAAQQAQAAADQAVLDKQKADAEAAAQAAAQSAAASSSSAAPAPAPAAGTAVTEVAHITNSAGPVRPQTQAAANAVVSNVPGADALTLGGTRASATDPDGHPSGLALDYMVLTDTALGNAIVAYHIAHWDELGVDYIIYRQRILMSPTGGWQTMADRGSLTANHMDHVHVNYRP